MDEERELTIIYDVVKKAVFVEFRGNPYYLEGPFASRRDGVRAAEELCRSLGWRPSRDNQKI